MPWSASDAESYTKKANTPHKRRIWANVVNERRAAGDSEATAIRKANAVIAKMSKRRK